MKNLVTWLFACLIVSCKQKSNTAPIHMVAVEVNGVEVSPDMFTDGFTPSRIYCYIIKDGKRINDGQEYKIVDRRNIEINEYLNGKVINSYVGKSNP